MVQIASVRRTLFSSEERAKFLTQLVIGVRKILENPQGLSEPSNYHEFCRLLLRLKSNYQLGELVTVEQYPEAIQLIAKFTVESLNMWQFAPNSVHYLLSLWQRMVGSVPYMKVSVRFLWLLMFYLFLKLEIRTSENSETRCLNVL